MRDDYRVNTSIDISIKPKARAVIEKLASTGVCVFSSHEDAMAEASRRANLISITLEAFEATGEVCITVIKREDCTGEALFVGPASIRVRSIH